MRGGGVACAELAAAQDELKQARALLAQQAKQQASTFDEMRKQMQQQMHEQLERQNKVHAETLARLSASKAPTTTPNVHVHPEATKAPEMHQMFEHLQRQQTVMDAALQQMRGEGLAGADGQANGKGAATHGGGMGVGEGGGQRFPTPSFSMGGMASSSTESIPRHFYTPHQLRLKRARLEHAALLAEQATHEQHAQARQRAAVARSTEQLKLLQEEQEEMEGFFDFNRYSRH